MPFIRIFASPSSDRGNMLRRVQGVPWSSSESWHAQVRIEATYPSSDRGNRRIGVQGLLVVIRILATPSLDRGNIIRRVQGVPWSSSESWRRQVRIEARPRGSNSPLCLVRLCYPRPTAGQSRRIARQLAIHFDHSGVRSSPGPGTPGRHPNLGYAKFG